MYRPKLSTSTQANKPTGRFSKADFRLALRVLAQKHGSGTGDHWHGGKGLQNRGPLIPLERFFNLSSPGRTDSHFPGRRSKGWQRRRSYGETGKRRRSGRDACRRTTRVLAVVHPQAAGIDLGNGSHCVAVRPDRKTPPTRGFECFTAALYRLADWLRNCGVKTAGTPQSHVLPKCPTNAVDWSTPGTPGTCPDARAMCRRASGC